MTLPARILLATDLSARGDRALDRAVRLARLWQAELVLAHIIEPRADMSPDWADVPSWQRGIAPAEQARRRIVRDLGELARDIRVVVEEGDPAPCIAAIAEREGCGLIVTGVARDETLGRMLLGDTVERLVRSVPIPLLVVKRRALRDYRNLLFTVDFSDASAAALRQASLFFPDANLLLFHGYDMPFALSETRDAFVDYLRRVERDEIDAFLAKADLDAAAREKVHVMIEHGDPVRLAASYVADNEPDLTVVASHGRSAVFDLTIGSVAYKLLRAVDSDVLLVRKDSKAA